MANTDYPVIDSSSVSAGAPGATQLSAVSEPLRPDDQDLMRRLSSHKTVGSAPAAELAWVVAHGSLHRYETGEVVSVPSKPISGMFIVLSGRMVISAIRGGTRHKMMEWHAGDVSGLLPYSRANTPPGETTAEEPTEMFLVPREHLAAMTRECHELTSILVHVMLDRARFFNAQDLHNEKLKSLGKLAAGLAHELNNPAAAIRRFAGTLPQALEAAESAGRALGAAHLTAEEQKTVEEMSAECLATPLRNIRSPLEEAERENAIADWLENHGVDGAAADVIAQSRVTIDALERFAGAVRPGTLETVIGWVAADCAVRSLASEIEHAASRISDLVTAVRGFTQVDASAVPQAVDIGEGLGQTLTVVGAKARGKSIGIKLTVPDNLPRVRGVTAELNQVWANLIDNALDAAPVSGSVEVTAASEKDAVVVRVIDNGVGVPPEITQKIFDPFFTTKDVGKGTGLGLDIVRRLVDRHNGDIEVQSRPGRTEFIVTLPIAELHGHGAEA